MRRTSPVLILAEIAIMAALAFILDFFSFKIWAQGGSVSFAMIPVFIIAYRRGLRAGLVTGLIFGLLNMLVNPYIVHWLQGLLDYPIAFLALGFAGLFKLTAGMPGKKQALYITAGIFIACLLRFLSHFTAGVVWFGEWAPEGTPVAVYSAAYNGTYMVPGFIISVIAVILLAKANQKLLHPNG
ncbi:thiamine transporter [Evansella caseinilytica]|uniref:Thiamine transporter n=1 Tax=Evansella caseinilytica TaxID=1503961 RepID=A0A1H3MDG9_9BACI|nr:energy-coupled thiamine transporter ThiT [Evansella caseinilytica]SDY74065.1 thiamine transporter [Evansella caseinilytica]